jgi:nucleoside-diphosphate-sugar epimerase
MIYIGSRDNEPCLQILSFPYPSEVLMIPSNTIAELLYQKNILITGASGFVGVSVISHLLSLASDNKITFSLELITRQVTDTLRRLKDQASSLGIPVVFVHSEIGQKIVPSRAVDIVFHFATPASTELNVNDPLKMLHTNVMAAEWITNSPELLKHYPKVVFSSSGAIYGPSDSNIPTLETSVRGPSPMAHGMAYAEGKRIAEMMLCEAGRDGSLEPVIARLFSFSGPGLPLDKHFAIGNFVKAATEEQHVQVRSNGLSTRSYLDSRDMSDWLIRASVLPVNGNPLHIGSESEVTIGELAEIVASRYKQLTDRTCAVSVLNETSRYDGFSYYVPSNQFTRQLLGVNAEISLSDSIDQMFRV